MTHTVRKVFRLGWLCIILIAGCGEADQKNLTHEVSNPLVEDGRWSALHAAVHEGNSARMKELLADGVDVNVNAVSKNDYSCTPLHLAAERGDVLMAQMLIVKGAEVNGSMSTGETPLHTAVKAGHRAMVVFLLSKGADASTESFYIQSPMALAQEMNRQDLVDALSK